MIEYLKELFRYLIDEYGYFGIFLVQLISSASIFFPVPGYVVVFVAGAKLNAFRAAVASGFGSAIGELSGYILGLGGKKLIGDRSELEAARRIFSRYGAGAIFLFAATPLPFDLAGIVCGTLKVDLRLFFFMTFIGKVTLSLLMVYTGRGTFEIFQSLIEGEFNTYSLLLVLFLVVLMIGPVVYWKILVDRLRGDQSSGARTADPEAETEAIDNMGVVRGQLYLPKTS
ncbi:DedA family protein [Candidatus Bathyarchaeota archaeon]|nr:DedA family protein [Candidatus Bathyarchaeota archaeon]